MLDVVIVLAMFLAFMAVLSLAIDNQARRNEMPSVFGLLVGTAQAHDNSTDWIGQEKRKNAAGVLCCGNGDCSPFTTDQVKTRPDGYHFPDGERVPFNKVAPSVDRFYWKCVWGGDTKCVFAPLGAS